MTLLAGLGLGFSLIIAIGAQNVFVLRQGIRREHVLLVAVICALSDAALITLGVAGVATVAQGWLLGAVRWAGALFLAGYGFLAARRALRPADGGLAAESDGSGGPAAAATPDEAASSSTLVATRAATATSVALTCLALTWLNPHVYLDTVFLVGSVAGAQGEHRWEFAAGAMLASVVWFFSLAYGGRLLAGVLASVRAWQVLDGVIAVIMVALAVGLVAA